MTPEEFLARAAEERKQIEADEPRVRQAVQSAEGMRGLVRAVNATKQAHPKTGLFAQLVKGYTCKALVAACNRILRLR
jgi:hypothetical protein